MASRTRVSFYLDDVDVDHYVDADGNGHLAALIKAESPVAVFHLHWQGLNPQTGRGWPAFRQMIDRLLAQFGDRLVWQRPSEIAAAYASRRGWAVPGPADQ